MIRGTTQIAYLKYATSQAPTSPMLLRSSHGRSLLTFHKKCSRTSGSEAIGHCVHLLSAHSNRRLSENAGTRPSSSSPLDIKLLRIIIAPKNLLSTVFVGILCFLRRTVFFVGLLLSRLVKMLKMGRELKNHSLFSNGFFGIFCFSEKRIMI